MTGRLELAFAHHPALYSWYDREHDLRWMPVIVINRIHSGRRSPVVVEWLPCVWVHIKAWEIATGNVDADAMTLPENHCSRVHVY